MIAEEQDPRQCALTFAVAFPFFTRPLSFRMNKNVSRSHNFVLRRN